MLLAIIAAALYLLFFGSYPRPWSKPGAGTRAQHRAAYGKKGFRIHILTPEKVSKARARYAHGESIRNLAKEHGMQRGSMWKVVTRKLWRDVP